MAEMTQEHKDKMQKARKEAKAKVESNKAEHLVKVNASVKQGLGESATDEQVKAEVERVLKGEELEANVSRCADNLYKASKSLDQFKNPPKAGSNDYTDAEKKVIRAMRSNA